MSQFKILKVKLINQGEKLFLRFRDNASVVSEDDKLCKEAVHPDLTNAVNSLAIHGAILSNYLTPMEAAEEGGLEDFTATGYSWNAKENSISLSCGRTTEWGKYVQFNVSVPTGEESSYELLKDLLTKVSLIETEVDKYLHRGKKAQGAMEFPDDKVTHAQIAEPDELAKFKTKDEWNAEEYSEEVEKTAALRAEDKVVPIKKGKQKAEAGREYTPEEANNLSAKKSRANKK